MALVSGIAFDWFVPFGYAASTFNVASAFMRTMIPLRAFAIFTNVCFIVYGGALGSIPIVVSHAILLPINVMRLMQMMRLTQQVEKARTVEMDLDWLKRYGTEVTVAAGDVLFRKGDTADAIYYPLEGKYVLEESGIELGAGQIFGELGLFSDANTRTQTLECREKGRLLKVTYSEVRQLYYQNPQFGFYLLNLVSRRLFDNIKRLETKDSPTPKAEGLAAAN